MARISLASPLARQLDQFGFVRAPAALSPALIESLMRFDQLAKSDPVMD